MSLHLYLSSSSIHRTLYTKATNYSGDSQVIRARCEPAETAVPNRSLMKNKKRRKRERGPIVTQPTWILERSTDVTDRPWQMDIQPQGRDRNLWKQKAWGGRKISPAEKCDNTEKDISKWPGWLRLRAEHISACPLKGKLSNFREVLLDHQLLPGLVGAVYYYQI